MNITDRESILDAEIRRYVDRGYRVQSRTPTTAQLVRPKSFSVGAAIFWTLFLLVGLLIYLLMYAAQRDDAVYLTVDEDGTVQAGGTVERFGPAALTDPWTCACNYRNPAHNFECTRCGAARPGAP